MLLWKEGKKSRGKNRHSVIRENLRVSNVPGTIRELSLVSVPEHQGLQGRGCCGRDTKEDWFCIFLGGPFRAILLPLGALCPGRRD